MDLIMSTTVTRRKFKVGDKARFKNTDRVWGYLKGATGTVIGVEPIAGGRSMYIVRYKHTVTGETQTRRFKSSELDRVDLPTDTFTVESYTNEIKPEIKQEHKQPIPVSKQQTNMFEVDDTSSWDDFCNKFKGELFK